MTNTSETIAFFGSGPVAAKSLELLAKDFDIEAVITKPRPIHHRGEVPVLALAEELKLPILTASTKSELDKLFQTRPVISKIGVLIDFGIIVSKEVINYFPLGIVNSHFSLLPEWRGADPITFAILSGRKQTGVSLMLLVETMDEGPLLAQSPFDIPESITTPELTKELIAISDSSLKKILPLYINEKVSPAPQEIITIAQTKQPSYSRKLTKDDGIIDWNKPADQIEREIRAYIEWPKSRAKFGDKEVIITKAHVVPVNHKDMKPGDLKTVEGMIMVECGSGTLCIERLKPAGKNEMTAQEFLRGNKI